MGVAGFVVLLAGADPIDSRSEWRGFAFFVGVPAAIVTGWLFERIIFGRRRRYPTVRRRPGARAADRLWRDRADATMRREEQQEAPPSDGPISGG